MSQFKADESKGTEMGDGWFATIILQGGPGSPNCPKRKRAYHRANKSRRALPGLHDFIMNNLIKEMINNFWKSALEKELTKDLPVLGLSASISLHDYENVDKTIEVVRGDY